MEWIQIFNGRKNRQSNRTANIKKKHWSKYKTDETIFFDLDVIVYSCAETTVLPLIIIIGQGLNAIYGYHSAMAINHDVVTTYVWQLSFEDTRFCV